MHFDGRCLILGFDGALFSVNGVMRYGTNQKTVAKWKKRGLLADLTMLDPAKRAKLKMPLKRCRGI